MISSSILAQNEESEYRANIIGGLGYGLFLSDLEADGLNKSGFSGTLRFMWEPEHLLRLGIETGYQQFYSQSQKNVDSDYGTTDIETSLTAVPFLFIFSMKIIDNFELTVGNGFYFLTSAANSFENNTTSTEPSTGLLVAGSYFYSLNESLSLGGELRWNYVQKIDDGSLSLQIQLKYALIKY